MRRLAATSLNKFLALASTKTPLFATGFFHGDFCIEALRIETALFGNASVNSHSPDIEGGKSQQPWRIVAISI